MKIDEKTLVEYAKIAMKKSYSPYSEFSVGVALLTSDGKVYSGCNIENASFTPTVCAERTAFFNAVSNGEKNFSAIAVVGGKKGEITEYCPPCGVCRQVMREFCADDFEIILFDGKSVKKFRLEDILPFSFKPENLE